MAKLPMLLKANRDRNKPMLKMNREQLERALAARDRIQEVSDEIRARAGLQPVPESPHMMAVRARLADLPAAKRKAPARSSRDTSTADPVAALEAWRKRQEREGEEIRAEAVRLFRERVAGATRIGKALGVKRQRVYQLADVA